TPGIGSNWLSGRIPRTRPASVARSWRATRKVKYGLGPFPTGGLSSWVGGSLASAQLAELVFIEAQHDLRSLDQNRPPYQVGMLGHQFDRLGSGGRIGLHLSLAVKLITKV